MSEAPILIAAFDTETHPFGPRNMAPKVVCASMALAGSDPHLFLAADAVAPLRALFEGAAVGQMIAVGQNVAYDMACLLAHYESDLGPSIWEAYDALGMRCTRVQERLLDVARGSRFEEREDGTFERKTYALDVLAKKRLGLELDKTTWRTGYAKLEALPLEEWPEGAREYAKTDASATLGVYLSQVEERARTFPHYDQWDEEAGRQAAFAFALQLVKLRGIEIDHQAVEDLRAQLVPKLETARALMIQHGLLDPRSGSKKMAAIMEVVEATWTGDGPVPRTAKGKVSTTADTIAQCLGHEGIEAFAEYKSVEKLLTTFVQKLADNKEGVVHPDYEVLGADTGRTSCRSPNIQQLPRAPGVRECFKARDGFVFISCDYDSQELRTLAQALQLLLGRSVLADRYREDPDFDPHTDFAAHLLGISYADAMARKKAKDPELLARRQQAKCFHPDTEILTRLRGWVRVSELTMDDEVAAAYPQRDGNTILGWEKPTALTQRPAPPDGLVRLLNKGMDLRVTADHRMLGFRQNGDPFVTTPDKLSGARCWAGAGVLRGSKLPGGDKDWSLLRLAVATQADGSYRGRQIAFGFTKSRKIERMRSMLAALPSEHWREGISSQGVTTFTLLRDLSDRIKPLLDPDKTLPWWWVSLPLAFREAILGEAAYWDSHAHANGRRFFYCSATRKNVDVLQAIAATTGRRSRLRQSESSWVASIGDHSAVRGGSLVTEQVPYAGDVFCLSVPSSFVLVRDGGVPVVTGQCANFGYPGGMGAEKFRLFAKGYDLDLTLAESAALKDGWLRQWPEMREYFALVGNRIDSGLTTFTQLQSGRLRGNVHFTNGCNTYFQGLASDASKNALWEVTKRCFGAPRHKGSALYGCRVVAFIHDELLVEAPESYAHEAAVELARVMCEAMEELTPDVPARASPALMRRWSKKAGTVRDADGRLIPWEDA